MDLPHGTDFEDVSGKSKRVGIRMEAVSTRIVLIRAICYLALLALVGGCSPVKFATQDAAAKNGPAGAVTGEPEEPGGGGPTGGGPNGTGTRDGNGDIVQCGLEACPPLPPPDSLPPGAIPPGSLPPGTIPPEVTLVPINETLTANVTNQVDIMFVVDTSGSMEADRRELASKLGNFTSQLGGLDWQICVTTTDIGRDNGNPLPFGPNLFSLKPTTPNFGTLFFNTVDLLKNVQGSGDERAIFALNEAVKRKTPDCFRNTAALATVILSDEDERSTGGYAQYETHPQYRALQGGDKPLTLIESVKAAWDDQKVFSAHSLVIRSGDTACNAAQSADGHAAFYGTRYEALAKSTGGLIGNICAGDYAGELKNFANGVVKSLDSVTMKCIPINKPTVTLTPAQPSVQVSTSGNKVFFTPALTQGTQVQVAYTCLGN